MAFAAMRFFHSQSEKHIRPESRGRSRSRDYDGRKIKADELFKFWQEIIFWTVLLSGIFFIFYVIHFQGLVDEEAMEIASRGRALVLGKEKAEGIIRPVFLEPGRSLLTGDSPLIAPVYPWIQGVFFKIGGFDDGSAVMGGSVFFLATALLTYALARRILDKNGALLVFLFTFANPVLLRAAISGRPTAFLVFIIVLIFYLREIVPFRYSCGLSGVLVGIAFLTDYSLIFFLPPLLIAPFFFRRERGRYWLGSALCLAGFLAALSPWLIGEVSSGRGSLSGYLGYHWRSASVLLPGRTSDGLYGFTLNSFTLPLSMLIGKIHRGLSLFYREALAISGNFIGLFFWGSFFSRGSRSDSRGRRLLVLCLLTAGGFWIILFQPCPDILVPLLPLVILYGTDYFLSLLERFSYWEKLASRVVLTGFIAANCLPLFFGRVAPDPLLGDMINSFDYLRTLVREEELVVTDIPARLRWYGNRPAVRLPLNPGMFREMVRGHPGTFFLLLSPRMAGREDLDPTGEWARIYNLRGRPVPENFDQVMLLPGRLVLMGKKSVLLNRISARW